MARDALGRPLADPRPCQNCKRDFQPTRESERRQGRHIRFCSISCRAMARRGQVPACVERFITPPSDKSQRIRANGLVNKRLKLGWFVLPTACQGCGAREKLDTHHTDYSKPGLILALCRSCHMSAHQRPEDFAHLPLIDTAAARPPRTYHGKGGRKGSTGKAAGRRPLRRIELVGTRDGTATEYLSCGHTFVRPDDGKRPIQRRCPSCPRAPLPQPQPAGGRDA